MELREIQRSDYELVLKLDSKVYPVSEENKVNFSSIDRWYAVYPRYGMIYCNRVTGDIVAMAIVIPMPISTWYQLKRGECFEHTLNIQWRSNVTTTTTTNININFINNNNYNNNNSSNSIGIHIYHIEVLNRDVVGHKFYSRVFDDLSKIARAYHHSIEAFSGYCVTPAGNNLFQHILKCHNTDDDSEDDDHTNTEPTSEFIVQHCKTGQIKIIEESRSTDIQQPYIDTSVQPAQTYQFISKCNMWYTLKKKDITFSPVWNYL